ncbi:chitin-binding domain protein [Fusarium avenaceum]|nr:chitin-binding domain protein [Fusarium avenaceum]
MKNAAALLALLPLVAAHGFIKSPTPRKPGNAFKAACGEQPFYQQSSDINGNVQGIKQVVGNSFDAADCNLWLCKGFQFDDNKDNVQSYKLGEKIPFEINIAAPHTGYANVSVVKTSSDSMIGEPLIEFENYASNSGTAANNTAFSVTLPESLGGDCTKAGDCVLQWFWNAPDIDQTYEACVDFVVGGSGSGSGSTQPKPTSAPVATSAAAEKPVPTTLQAVAVTTSIVPSTTEAPVSGDDEDCDDEEPATGADDEDCDDEEEPPVSDQSAEDEDCDEDEEPATGDDDEECPADEGDDY